jgi:hypothetical protein
MFPPLEDARLLCLAASSLSIAFQLLYNIVLKKSPGGSRYRPDRWREQPDRWREQPDRWREQPDRWREQPEDVVIDNASFNKKNQKIRIVNYENKILLDKMIRKPKNIS